MRSQAAPDWTGAGEGLNEDGRPSAEQGNLACRGGLGPWRDNCGWLHRVRLEYLVVVSMSLPTRETELLAVALSVERTHGADGPRVIAEKIGSLICTGEIEAAVFWREVARTYEQHLLRKSEAAHRAQ